MPPENVPQKRYDWEKGLCCVISPPQVCWVTNLHLGLYIQAAPYPTEHEADKIDAPEKMAR